MNTDKLYCIVLCIFTQCIYLFIYLGCYIAFNTVQVISWWLVGRAEETSTYSSSGFCTVNCRPTASNYQLSHLRPCQEPNPGLRGGRRECYNSATVAPFTQCNISMYYRTTESAIWPIWLFKYSSTLKLLIFPHNWKIEAQGWPFLSTSLRFFNLPLGIGPNGKGPPF